MATNYPSSLDTSSQQPSPSSTTDLDATGYEHDVVHTNHSGAIIALETKLGTTDSNATANAVLMGTGSGTSEWDTSPTFKGAVTVGVDDTGHDVKFFGATSDSYFLWDESADQLIIRQQSSGNGLDTGLVLQSHQTSDVNLVIGDGIGIDFWIPSDDSPDTFHTATIAASKTSDTDANEGTRLEFQTTENGGSIGTRMVIDDTGNVGIGTTTPMRELDVWSEVLIHHGDIAWLWQNAGADFKLWHQTSYTSGDSGWSQKLNIDGTGSTDLKIDGGSGTGYTQASLMISCPDDNRGAGVYMFNEALDKTWYAGMPYTSTDRYIMGRVDASSLSASAAAASGALFEFRSNGAAYNTTGTWGNSSDVRMKGDIETARSYLADLNQLRIVTYKLTKDPQLNEDMELEFVDRESPSEKMLGLIAQEVESVFPAMVTDGTKEAMAIKQSVLIPMLITAVQELTTRIEALEG